MDVDDEEEEIWDTRSFKQLKIHLRNSTRDKERDSEGQDGPRSCRDKSGVPFKRKRLKSSGFNSTRRNSPNKASRKSSQKESSEEAKQDSLAKPKPNSKPKPKGCRTRAKLSSKRKTKCANVSEQTSSGNETSSSNLGNEVSECGSATPVKHKTCRVGSAGEISFEPYCPKCQMPFRGLNGQSPQWHVIECLNTRQTPIGLCPQGSACTLSSSSHFRRFSHHQLALRRSYSPPKQNEHTGKPPLSRKLNFSNNETLTVDSTDPECSKENSSNDTTECVSLVDDSSDLELFDLDSDEDLENGTSVIGNCNGDNNLEWSSVGSDLETVSSVTGRTDDTLRSVTGEVDETVMTVISQTNDSFMDTGINGDLVTGIDQKDDTSTSMTDQQVFICFQELGSLEIPAETNDDEDVESKEGVETFTGKYDCSEDRANKSEISTENESENEIYDDQGLRDGQTKYEGRRQLISSVRTKTVSVSIETDAVSDESLNGASSYDVGRDVQLSNSGDIDDFCQLSSQEVQTKSQNTMQTCLSVELNTQNRCVMNKNNASDTKQLTLTSLYPKSQTSKNKSNNTKCFKQQDIGVYFGLKARQNPTTKVAMIKTNKSSQSSKRAVSDVVKGKGQVSNKRGTNSSAVNSFDKSSSEQDVSSGNNEEAQASTTYRRCPFYKKIPGTPFTVDAFKFGRIPGCKAYFLSHFHYDHYGGLHKSFSEQLFCSKITANLVQTKIRVSSKNIKVLPMYKPVMVEGVEVTLLEANHCPGAVLFLFRLPSGQVILHTGDFRASPSMENYPGLRKNHINVLYLDTTYCNPQYSFPPQEETIKFAVTKAVDAVQQNPKTLIVCGSYTIGKERVFVSIAEALGVKVSVAYDKKRILDCLESNAIKSLITTDWKQGRVHVLPMASLTHKALTAHLKKHSPRFDAVMAFKPTGWEHKASSLSATRPSKTGSVTIYGVPYSEHSSYSELERFVKFVRPDRIIPTVNNYSAASRAFMADMFNTWLSSARLQPLNCPIAL